MNKIFIVPLILSLVQGLNGQPNLESSEQIFDIWIKSKLKKDKWPGAIIGIVKDQKLIWSKSYGYANLETKQEIQPETLFAIASNTKMFTAIGIMKLRNQGLLHLDDPVSKYIPEISKIKSFEDATPDKITIRQMLTHTSGLPVEPWHFNWRKRPQLDEIVQNLENQTLSIPVSTDFKYSNLGYSLLGRIIENISGKSYEEFMTNDILSVIGMHHSGFDIEAGKIYATGYQPLRGKTQREQTPLLDYNGWSSAGGLYSNLNDLVKYVSWLIRTHDGNDSTLLNAETLREMHRVSWVPKSWAYGIGLGFFIYKNPEKMIGHGGHNPGFRSDITIFPESKLGIITLANGEEIPELPDDTESIAAQVIKYIVPNFKSPPVGRKEGKSLNLEPYEGIYAGYWGEYQVIKSNSILTMFRISDKNPDSYKLELAPTKAHTFRVTSSDLGRWRGEQVDFNNMIDGKMTELLMDGTTFYRVQNK